MTNGTTLLPEIIKALKLKFAEVVQRYARDRDGFINERRSDGSLKDSTQLYGFLYDFIINDYLGKELDPKSYRALKDALNYAESKDARAVAAFYVLAEHLLDKNSSLLEHEFYAKKNRKDFDSVRKSAENGLKKLGCEITDGEIVNMQEIIQGLVKNGKSSKKIVALWKQIIETARRQIYPLQNDLIQEANLYLNNLYDNIITKALTILREEKEGVLSDISTLFTR